METNVETPSYQSSLKELRNQLGSMLPPEALSVFDADAAQLQVVHTDILKAKVGDVAPDFTLGNAKGEKITLSELVKNGKVVMTFYRGTWCPYCNLQLRQYQQVLTEIKEKGAQLVAISPQTPDASLNMQQKNELQFEVLSDVGNIVAKQYTTVFRNADIPVETMTTLGFDFDGHYADDSRELPVPAVFIIEQDGKIVLAATEGGDYRNRTEATTILEMLS